MIKWEDMGRSMDVYDDFTIRRENKCWVVYVGSNQCGPFNTHKEAMRAAKKRVKELKGG